MRGVGRRALDRLQSSASRERILRYADEAGFAPVTVADRVSPHLIIVIKPLA